MRKAANNNSITELCNDISDDKKLSVGIEGQIKLV